MQRPDPLTERLVQAIDRLYPEPSRPRLLVELPAFARERSTPPPEPPAERARALRLQLETYLGQMADEAEEYGDSIETHHLREQGVGLLLALRELWKHLPECGD